MKLKLDLTETATLHLLFSFFLEDPSLRTKDKAFFTEVINSLITQDGKALYLRQSQFSQILDILDQSIANLPSGGSAQSIGSAITSLRKKLIEELTEDQESETLGATIEKE